MKAQPDHWYLTDPGQCVRCGVLRRPHLTSFGRPHSYQQEWSHDGGKTWTTKHTACPMKKESIMSENEKKDEAGDSITVPSQPNPIGVCSHPHVAIERRAFEGTMQPFHETLGWYVQGPIDARNNNPGYLNGATMFQWAIGKKVRVTVEVIE